MKPKKLNGYSEMDSAESVLSDVKLHISEKRLIELIRSINEGEISSIKVQNGLPVFYIINLENRRLN
jgi:hypothetical protein